MMVHRQCYIRVYDSNRITELGDNRSKASNWDKRIMWELTDVVTFI